MQTIVYKIGGSLLGLPDLKDRLNRLLAPSASRKPLVIAGGGETADVVRRWDAVHRLGDDRAHWLAIRSLSLNEALLHELLPGSQLVETRTAAETAWQRERVPILCAHRFFLAEEPESDRPLPHSWDVTSDSIAAWIALRWPADALVLVKSTNLNQSGGHDAVGRNPLVDTYFAALAPHLPKIGWVNLRADRPEVETWTGFNASACDVEGDAG